MTLLHRLACAIRADRRGISALEYALLSAVIGGFIVVAGWRFGNSLGTAYNTIGNTLVSTASPAPPASTPTPPPSSTPIAGSPAAQTSPKDPSYYPYRD